METFAQFGSIFLLFGHGLMYSTFMKAGPASSTVYAPQVDTLIISLASGDVHMPFFGAALACRRALVLTFTLRFTSMLIFFVMIDVDVDVDVSCYNEHPCSYRHSH